MALFKRDKAKEKPPVPQENKPAEKPVEKVAKPKEKPTKAKTETKARPAPTGNKPANLQAYAKTRLLRTSPQKLNLVAQTIRGKKVELALNELTFSRKRIAVSVKKTLESAIANAETNHSLNIDDLIVAEAFVGKNLRMRRYRPRAKGRGAPIIKPFSELTIIVREVPPLASKGAA